MSGYRDISGLTMARRGPNVPVLGHFVGTEFAGKIMEFEYVEHISHPVAEVFELLQNNLSALIPLLPGVDAIEELSRESEGSMTRITNLWQGNSKSAPAAARPFVTRKMTAWHDHATWDSAKHEVQWRFETLHFDTLYECSGIHYFSPEPNPDGSEGTRLRMTGDLRVYPERVPGVPKLLARSVRPKVEAFLIEMVTPNLKELPHAMQTHLDAAR